MVRIRKDSVGILGLSKSGLAAAKLYKDIGFKVNGFDDNCNLVIDQDYKQYFKEIFLGRQPNYILNEMKNYKYLIVSPGVPFDHYIIQNCKSLGVPVISEIEAGYKVLTKNNSKFFIIAITGTNGKSTVTTLIYQFLKSHIDGDIFIGGNIGIPFCEVVYNSKFSENPIIVLELSSFQLKMTNNFRSQIAIITNITSDHLDRHPDLQDYIKSKLKLLYFQLKKDNCIINFEDHNTLSYLKSSKIKSSINSFSWNSTNSSIFNSLKINYYALNKDNEIVIRNSKKSQDLLRFNVQNLSNSIFKRVGIYLENLMPALLAIFLYLRNYRKQEINLDKIIQVLDNFVPLDHRLIAIGNYRNIEFFNDSKATNIQATKASLETVRNYYVDSNIKNFGIILLMGGVPKYSSKEEMFKELEKMALEVKNNLLGIITFGKHSDLFINPFMKTSLKYMYAFSSLEQAFQKAIDLGLLEGNNFDKIGILLAPGGASFDQFKSAEERGKMFEKLVEDFLFQKAGKI